MTGRPITSWLADRSSAPNTVLKPIASRLGVPANYLGAALFAGQLVYENQDAIVEYTSKTGVTVGEFLHAQARERYGADHPLTQHLGENVEAISEAFAGTEAEARTFAAFYREYRAVERDHRLRDEVGRRVADLDRVDLRPDRVVPGVLADRLPAPDGMPIVSGLFGSESETGESVEIPVVDSA